MLNPPLFQLGQSVTAAPSVLRFTSENASPQSHESPCHHHLDHTINHQQNSCHLIIMIVITVKVVNSHHLEMCNNVLILLDNNKITWHLYIAIKHYLAISYWSVAAAATVWQCQVARRWKKFDSTFDLIH